MDLSQVKKIQSRLKEINQSKVEELLKKEILANGKEIVDLVRNRWDKGLRPNGQIIGVYRDAEYASFKMAINPSAGGNVDLTLTRSLRDKLNIFPMHNAIYEIFSLDEKAVDIAAKYGIDVYGLTKEEETRVLFEASSRVNKKLFDFVGI